MLRMVVAFLLIVAAVQSMAADNARQQKIAAIAQAAGLQDMFEQMLRRERAELEGSADKLIQKVLEAAPDLTAEKKNEYLKLSKE
jgi:hypothetical protein